MPDSATLDLAGAVVGFILTIFVFSYILGDNPLFRVAVHIFVGVSAGFAAVIAWYNVILPQLIRPLLAGSLQQRALLLIPLAMGGLLLFKASPRLSRLGNLPLAYLVGVGGATAVGGAVLGTLFPQISASVDLFDVTVLPDGQAGVRNLVVNALILASTLVTLIYFQFGASQQAGKQPRRQAWIESLAAIGKAIIAVTFGALFAGVYMASLSALIERLNSLLRLFLPV